MQIFDKARLQSITGGNAAIESELMQLFRETLDKCLTELKIASDQETFHAACHELKGAAANLGADRLSEACTGVGAAAATLEARAAIFAQIEAEVALLRAEIG
ncbi:MAG: Hpt domain-containing protein [Hyphomicrobiales bacterium]|nr:Hpt domain-containing protein [Rickettsiales bacterium]MCP5361312.1 Hpt domain-containing protein [Hyphomicrobiales bacterium]